jgi:hypothetical protein
VLGRFGGECIDPAAKTLVLLVLESMTAVSARNAGAGRFCRLWQGAIVLRPGPEPGWFERNFAEKNV